MNEHFAINFAICNILVAVACQSSYVLKIIIPKVLSYIDQNISLKINNYYYLYFYFNDSVCQYDIFACVLLFTSTPNFFAEGNISPLGH